MTSSKQISDAAKEARALVEHTAKMTADALLKFTEKTATMAADITYIKDSLAEIKQTQRDTQKDHDGYLKKIDYTPALFATKEGFHYWRNLLVGGLSTLFVALV